MGETVIAPQICPWSSRLWRRSWEAGSWRPSSWFQPNSWLHPPVQSLPKSQIWPQAAMHAHLPPQSTSKFQLNLQSLMITEFQKYHLNLVTASDPVKLHPLTESSLLSVRITSLGCPPPPPPPPSSFPLSVSPPLLLHLFFFPPCPPPPPSSFAPPLFLSFLSFLPLPPT